MPAAAKFKVDALAVGTNTSASVKAKANAAEGRSTDTSSVDVTATASGDALAATAVETFTYAGDDDGSGAGVQTATSGLAVGGDAYSTSTTKSFAISTNGADVAFALTRSRASGDGYEDAYASTDPYGDVTGGGGMDVDNPNFSTALSVGVAVDIA